MIGTPRRAAWLVAIAVVAGVVMWRPTAQWLNDRRAWQSVTSAFGVDNRTFEPRLSGMPFAQPLTLRSAGASRVDPSADLLLAVATLEERASARPSAFAWRRAAMGQLLSDKSDRAVASMTRALSFAPWDASLQSDLAGVYLIRARRSGSFADVVQALDAAARATDTAADMPAAWFNRALSLSVLGLSAESAAAFQRAATTDTSGWADEARRRASSIREERGRGVLLAQLVPTVVAGSDTALRASVSADADLVAEVLERTLLARWAESSVAGDDTAAARSIARARIVATEIAAATGDRHAEALVDALASCPACARGWIDHLEALTAWDEDRFSDIRAPAARADEAFGDAVTPINAARLPIRVTVARLDGRRADALGWLSAFTPYCQQHDFLLLWGRLLWQQGLLASESGDFGAALAAYHKALLALERVRDREGASMVASLLAYEYRQLDEMDTAWQHAMTALQRLPYARPLRRGTVLSIAAMLASSTGLDAAALVFRAPVVDEARRHEKSNTLPFRLIEDAENLQQLGDRTRARERLKEAASRTEDIHDPGALMMAHARVFGAEGRLLRGDEPAHAADLLQQAIDMSTARKDLFAVPALELDRGRALAALGRTDEAVRAFRQGIDVAEHGRRIAVNDADRVAALSARWDLYSELIDVYVHRNDDGAAIDLLRRGRAANLVEEMSSDDAADPLPTGTIAVEYVVLPSQVVGWITDRGGRSRFTVGATPAALESAVNELRSAIEQRRPPATVDARSTRLYALLFGPVRARVASAARIVVVPDGPLHALPFAALRDDVSGQRVIDRSTVVVTPSLAFYRTRIVASQAVRDGDALVFGNPDRAGALGDRLPPLPAAEAEARDIAAVYSHPVLMLGRSASRRAFLDHAPTATMIHFAGHALISDRWAESSRLLVAPTDDDPIGAVFFKDIHPHSLPNVRLVVLSACETARGQVMRGEGVNGLVRAFLMAGAPTVVATLWPVDDRAAATLFREFHQRVADGASAEDALRGAQLQLVRRGWTDLADWAAPTVIGRLTPPSLNGAMK